MAAIDPWDRIVAEISAGDPAGQQALYDAFAPGLRLFLAHHLRRAEEVEDRLHDIFVKAVSAIREGQLREPGRIAGFMRTIARRQITAFIDEVVEQRSAEELAQVLSMPSQAPSPEQMAIQNQWRERAIEVLGSFSGVDREILLRYYLLGEEPEEICEGLRISYNQFRMRKSRAKRRFAQMMRRKERKNPWQREDFLRQSAASGH
jgi:RNA polymerase sigma-70 factor (ECF subfamily)